MFYRKQLGIIIAINPNIIPIFTSLLSTKLYSRPHLNQDQHLTDHGECFFRCQIIPVTFSLWPTPWSLQYTNRDQEKDKNLCRYQITSVTYSLLFSVWALFAFLSGLFLMRCFCFVFVWFCFDSVSGLFLFCICFILLWFRVRVVFVLYLFDFVLTLWQGWPGFLSELCLLPFLSVTLGLRFVNKKCSDIFQLLCFWHKQVKTRPNYWANQVREIKWGHWTA